MSAGNAMHTGKKLYESQTQFKHLIVKSLNNDKTKNIFLNKLKLCFGQWRDVRC